ncbi:MAG: hypothetical protein U9R27_06480 [Campylobacterota bacterium]|nr:hypothetical protein [Campylobacterota bacterium]
MNIESLTAFFMWSTIINGAIFLYWVFFILFIPDFIYRMQSRWFSIPRETYDVVIYSFLGLFKIFFVIFSLSPYLALLIIGK